MYNLTVLIEAFDCDGSVVSLVNDIESELTNKNLRGEIFIYFNRAVTAASDKPVKLKTNTTSLTIVDLSNCEKNENLLSYALRYAKSDNFIFFDIRYSLSPGIIPALFHELESGNDLVIGKRNYRHIKNERHTKDRNYRTLIENNLLRLLFPNIYDPTSDIFAIKKDLATGLSLKNPKIKLLPEILGKENWKDVKEISLDPYETRDTVYVSERFLYVQYIFQMLSILIFSIQHRNLAGWKEIRTVIKFGIVGITGIFINMCLLYIFSEIFNIFYLISSFLAIELSIIHNFIWNDVWTFGNEKNPKISTITNRFLSYHIVSTGGMLINISALIVFTELLGIYYLISNLLGIFIAFSWNFIMNRMTTWRIKTSW